MALVDYSSDDGSLCAAGGKFPPEEDSPRPTKRRRTGHAEGTCSAAEGTEGSSTALPPLPDAFHDLYAHTVRTSNVDDPALHQGRRRLVPHKVGNWPSHLYIEWHPSETQHVALSSMLEGVKSNVEGDFEIFHLITSDLGDFLYDVTQATQESGIRPFTLHFKSLSWHRTEESGRTFLVLRVISDADHNNSELVTLLSKFNSTAKKYGQPPLYCGQDDERRANAFHISIGWTASRVTDSMIDAAKTAFTGANQVRKYDVTVDAIKAKIGNLVTSLSLSSSTVNKASHSSVLGFF